MMSTESRIHLFAVIVALLMIPTSTQCATIQVGDLQLRPRIASQMVELFATGTEMVRGLEFNLQVGDGGIDLGGRDTGPIITDVDLVSGTIFSDNGAVAVQTDVAAFPLAQQVAVNSDRAVLAEGLIATISFDARESSPMTLDLLLSGVAGEFNTTFIDSLGDPLATELVNGTITVTPEPSFGLSFAYAFVIVTAHLTRRPER